MQHPAIVNGQRLFTIDGAGEFLFPCALMLPEIMG